MCDLLCKETFEIFQGALDVLAEEEGPPDNVRAWCSRHGRMCEAQPNADVAIKPDELTNFPEPTPTVMKWATSTCVAHTKMSMNVHSGMVHPSEISLQTFIDDLSKTEPGWFYHECGAGFPVFAKFNVLASRYRIVVTYGSPHTTIAHPVVRNRCLVFGFKIKDWVWFSNLQQYRDLHWSGKPVATGDMYFEEPSDVVASELHGMCASGSGRVQTEAAPLPSPDEYYGYGNLDRLRRYQEKRAAAKRGSGGSKENRWTSSTCIMDLHQDPNCFPRCSSLLPPLLRSSVLHSETFGRPLTGLGRLTAQGVRAWDHGTALTRGKKYATSWPGLASAYGANQLRKIVGNGLHKAHNISFIWFMIATLKRREKTAPSASLLAPSSVGEVLEIEDDEFD